MGTNKHTQTRRAKLKKETVRRLETAALAQEQLRLVAGGTPIPTLPCRTK
jgi:hypothetical protein